MKFEGDPVRVSRDGWFLIGFGRDAPPKAVLSVVFPDGRRH
ncbi:MAG: M23 family peptidase, partial [Gammaproteobacteria bacterium]|nr:M23 family peptidase [Gammaproteobacteria bacterium]